MLLLCAHVGMAMSYANSVFFYDSANTANQCNGYDTLTSMTANGISMGVFPPVVASDDNDEDEAAANAAFAPGVPECMAPCDFVSANEPSETVITFEGALYYHRYQYNYHGYCSYSKAVIEESGYAKGNINVQCGGKFPAGPDGQIAGYCSATTHAVHGNSTKEIGSTPSKIVHGCNPEAPGGNRRHGTPYPVLGAPFGETAFFYGQGKGGEHIKDEYDAYTTIEIEGEDTEEGEYGYTGAFIGPDKRFVSDNAREGQDLTDTCEDHEPCSGNTPRNDGRNKGESLGFHRLYTHYFEGTTPTFDDILIASDGIVRNDATCSGGVFVEKQTTARSLSAGCVDTRGWKSPQFDKRTLEGDDLAHSPIYTEYLGGDQLSAKQSAYKKQFDVKWSSLWGVADKAAHSGTSINSMTEHVAKLTTGAIPIAFYREWCRSASMPMLPAVPNTVRADYKRGSSPVPTWEDVESYPPYKSGATGHPNATWALGRTPKHDEYFEMGCDWVDGSESARAFSKQKLPPFTKIGGKYVFTAAELQREEKQRFVIAPNHNPRILNTYRGPDSPCHTNSSCANEPAICAGACQSGFVDITEHCRYQAPAGIYCAPLVDDACPLRFPDRQTISEPVVGSRCGDISSHSRTLSELLVWASDRNCSWFRENYCYEPHFTALRGNGEHSEKSLFDFYGPARHCCGCRIKNEGNVLSDRGQLYKVASPSTDLLAEASNYIVQPVGHRPTYLRDGAGSGWLPDGFSGGHPGFDATGTEVLIGWCTGPPTINCYANTPVVYDSAGSVRGSWVTRSVGSDGAITITLTDTTPGLRLGSPNATKTVHDALDLFVETEEGACTAEVRPGPNQRAGFFPSSEIDHSSTIINVVPDIKCVDGYKCYRCGCWDTLTEPRVAVNCGSQEGRIFPVNNNELVSQSEWDFFHPVPPETFPNVFNRLSDLQFQLDTNAYLKRLIPFDTRFNTLYFALNQSSTATTCHVVLSVFGTDLDLTSTIQEVICTDPADLKAPTSPIDSGFTYKQCTINSCSTHMSINAILTAAVHEYCNNGSDQGCEDGSTSSFCKCALQYLYRYAETQYKNAVLYEQTPMPQVSPLRAIAVADIDRAVASLTENYNLDTTNQNTVAPIPEHTSTWEWTLMDPDVYTIADSKSFVRMPCTHENDPARPTHLDDIHCDLNLATHYFESDDDSTYADSVKNADSQQRYNNDPVQIGGPLCDDFVFSSDIVPAFWGLWNKYTKEEMSASRYNLFDQDYKFGVDMENPDIKCFPEGVTAKEMTLSSHRCSTLDEVAREAHGIHGAPGEDYETYLSRISGVPRMCFLKCSDSDLTDQTVLRYSCRWYDAPNYDDDAVQCGNPSPIDGGWNGRQFYFYSQAERNNNSGVIDGISYPSNCEKTRCPEIAYRLRSPDFKGLSRCLPVSQPAALERGGWENLRWIPPGKTPGHMFLNNKDSRGLYYGFEANFSDPPEYDMRRDLFGNPKPDQVTPYSAWYDQTNDNAAMAGGGRPQYMYTDGNTPTIADSPNAFETEKFLGHGIGSYSTSDLASSRTAIFHYNFANVGDLFLPSQDKCNPTEWYTGAIIARQPVLEPVPGSAPNDDRLRPLQHMHMDVIRHQTPFVFNATSTDVYTIDPFHIGTAVYATPEWHRYTNDAADGRNLFTDPEGSTNMFYDPSEQPNEQPDSAADKGFLSYRFRVHQQRVTRNITGILMTKELAAAIGSGITQACSVDGTPQDCHHFAAPSDNFTVWKNPRIKCNETSHVVQTAEDCLKVSPSHPIHNN